LWPSLTHIKGGRDSSGLSFENGLLLFWGIIVILTRHDGTELSLHISNGSVLETNRNSSFPSGLHVVDLFDHGEADRGGIEVEESGCHHCQSAVSCGASSMTRNKRILKGHTSSTVALPEKKGESELRNGKL
jgi:hypothetical protein